MKTFSLWIIIHVALISIWGIVSIQMYEYRAKLSRSFFNKSGFKSQFNPITLKRGDLYFMVTSPHTVALHHISDKLTEPLPSSIEHLGRTYQLTYLNPCSLVKNFGLTETILPDTIKGIGYYAFSDVYTLTNIILSSNLKMIEEGAFNWCTELRSVYFKSDAPPEIFEDNFTHCHPELTFYYPEEYKANWPETLNGIPCRPWNPEKSANRLKEENEKPEEQTESFSP